MATVGDLKTKISLDSAEFERSMASVNRELRGLKHEQKAVTSSGTGFARGLTELRGKADVLNRTYDLQQKKVAELKRRYEESKKETGENSKATEQANIAYQKAKAEMNKTENALKGVTSEIERQSNPWNKLGKNMNEFGTKMQNFGRGMTDFGKAYSMRVTAPIVAGGVAMFKASMDYESAFAGVRKTVDATEEQFATLSAGIREMSKELPQSAVEIANVAEVAGQLGIKQEDILKFTRTMVDLGVATNMSSEQAATSLARLANITQMPMDQIDRLGSTVVDLGNNLATTEHEIVEMGLRIAGAGHQIGLTEAQILALAGSLSSVGIRAEAGGSAISRVMINMAQAVEMGGDDLKNFARVAGMSVSDFRKSFEVDAADALVTFIEGLANLDDQSESTFVMLDKLGLSEIRVRDALLRASGAGDLFRNSLELGNKAWDENIALTNEAEERYKTTESQLKIMWNRIKDVAITMGNNLAPAVMDAIDAAEPFIKQIESGAKAFSDMDTEQQRTILKMIALVAALGPASVGIGQLSLGIGGLVKAGGSLSTMMGKARGPGLIGRIALLGPGVATPVGLAVAGVGALGLGLYALHKQSQENKEISTELSDSYRSQADSLQELVDEFNELNSKSRLTTEEFGRLMDIQSELNKTQNPALIAELSKEYDELIEKSGLTKDEINRLIEANNGIIEQSPQVEKSYTDQGNALVESTEAAQAYINKLNEMSMRELEIERGKALAREAELLEEQTKLREELAIIEKEIGFLIDAQLMSEEQRVKRLEEIDKELDNQKLSHDEISTLLEEQAALEQVRLGTTEKAFTELEKQRNKLIEKIELNDQELAKLSEIEAKMVDLLLSEVGLNFEKGKGLEQLDKEISKLEKTRAEIVKNTSSEEKKTQEYRDQIGELDTAIGKHKDIRDKIKEETGYQSEHNKKLDDQSSKLDKNKRLLDMGVSSMGKQGQQQDNTNQKIAMGVTKAEEQHSVLSKDVTKDVNVTDNGTVNKINKEASKPLTKTVKLNALWSGVQSGLRVAMSRINIPGFAKGTSFHPGGTSWVGEEGFELARLGGNWAMLDFGLANIPRGTEIFTHDESKQILSALNNIPGYASGVSRPGEANRVIKQIGRQDDNEVVKALEEQNKILLKILEKEAIAPGLIGSISERYQGRQVDGMERGVAY